jgi:HSP20 family protein
MSTLVPIKSGIVSNAMVTFPKTRNIFEEFENLSNEIARRAFGFFRNRGRADGGDLDDWFRAESELLKPLPIEMSESSSGYTIRAEVPGFEAKDLNVQLEQDSIYIHGKSEQKKEEKKGKEARYSEVSSQEICRRIDLPGSVDPDKIEARLINGVLELNLTKSGTPAKKIEVKSAA